MVDILYKRIMLAIAAGVSVCYLINYFEQDGARSLLSIIGILALGVLMANIPFWIENRYLDTRKKKQSTREVLLSIKTTKWGPNGLESDDRMRVSDSYDGDCVNLSVSFNPRKVDRIEISPIRRPLSDAKGLADDAERLANEPLN